MKLIFCPSCQDLVKLLRSKRTCHCGKSWGEYTDHIKAKVGGYAIPIGIDNKTFVDAIKRRNQDLHIGGDHNFNAFVFDLITKNIIRE